MLFLPFFFLSPPLVAGGLNRTYPTPQHAAAASEIMSGINMELVDPPVDSAAVVVGAAAKEAVGATVVVAAPA